VLTIYFLVDLPRLERSAVLLVPRADRARFGHIGGVLVDKVGSYMIGNILISWSPDWPRSARSPRSGCRSPCRWPSWSR
jgi:hypothetical protein